uniref:Uncharacterized protein n=1 Tax=Neobodo designis TaxID=312471 RepID=A0A7S1MPL9_NEODS
MGDYQKRLSSWDAQLDRREENVEAAEDDLNRRVDTLNRDIATLRQKTDQLNADREALAKEREFERELEIEAERRRRADREKQRQHERQMESELKKQEKAVDSLQRATEEQQMAQAKLERELGRISREREQHRRDAQWARDKEQEWNRERVALERKIREVQEELAGANSTIESLNNEMKGQRQVEAGLREDNTKQQAVIDYFEGRATGEADADWQRRRESTLASLEAAKKGAWHHASIQIDNVGQESSTVAFALGSVEPVRVMKCNVVVAHDGPVASGTVEFEIGEGFVTGDLLTVLGSADGVVSSVKGPLANVEPSRPNDLLVFSLNPGAEISSSVAAVLNSVGFVATNALEFGGVRTIEFSINVTSAKQTSVAISGQVHVAVIPSAFDAFREALPFTERAAPVPVFGHVRLKNPFSDLSTRAYAAHMGAKFFAHGFKGPNREDESASLTDATQVELVRKHASAIGRRCLTCAQPRLAQRFTLSEWSGQSTSKAQEGMFADFELRVTLDRLQPEDTLMLDRKDAIRHQVKFTLNDDGTEVFMRSMDRSVTREVIGTALQAIQFSSSATPLDERARKITVFVRIPHMPIALEWTSVRALTIVNAAHHVKVSADLVDRVYRNNTSTVSGNASAAPRLWFADDVEVSDPFASKFRGSAVFTLRHPTLRVHKDTLGLAAPPALDGNITVESHTTQDPPPVRQPDRWSPKSAPIEEAPAMPVYIRGTVCYSGVEVCTFKLLDSATRLELTFTPQTTSDSATAVFRSVFFESEDITPLVRRTIKCVAALGRGTENTIDFTVTSQMPIVAVERLGGMKWTEHQGPMPAGSHFGLVSALAESKPPPAPQTLLHVFIGDGFESGDVLAYKGTSTTKAAARPSTLWVRGVDWAGRVKSASTSRDGLVAAYRLDDDSLLIRVANTPPPADGKEIPSLEPLNDVGLLREALQQVLYEHTSSSPSVFRKVLCVRSMDFMSTYSDACVPLNVVPIDDPTEIHDLPEKTLYSQGSREALSGFRLAPSARVVDSDTDDFIGGTLMIEPAAGSYVSGQDQLYLLSPQQQRDQDPEGAIVFVDERNRVHLMPSFEAFVAYEALVQEDVCTGGTDDADDGVPRFLCHSVGLLTITDLSDQFTASPGSPEPMSPASPSKKKKEKDVAPKEVNVPCRWEVFFKPPRQRTITLDCVQTILRCFAWRNNSGRIKRRSRAFTVTLGAGALGAAVNVEGARVADKTVLDFSVKIAPGVFHVPQGASDVPYQRNGGAQPVSKALMILPLSPYVKVHRGRLVIRLVGTREQPCLPEADSKDAKVKGDDDESISLGLRRDSGMEIRGDQLVSSGAGGSTALLGTVATISKSIIAINFSASARIDTKQLQTLARSVMYNCSSSAKEANPREVRTREIEIALEDALHFSSGALPSSSDEDETTECAQTEANTGEQAPSDASPAEAHGGGDEAHRRESLCVRFKKPVHFACRVKVHVSSDLCNASTLQQMISEPPFTIMPPERPLEYTMRCGASKIFNTVQTTPRPPSVIPMCASTLERSPVALLRPPSTFTIYAPPGVAAPLQLAEDAIVSTAEPSLDTYALPRLVTGRGALRVSMLGESSADLARSTTAGNSFAVVSTCVEVRFNGHAVALMTTASRTRNALHFEFLACPPQVVGELLRRVSFMGGGKKDRPGAKHLFKCTFSKGPGLPDETTTLTAVVTPPYVEEIVGSRVAFSGPATFPFVNAKVKTTVSFGGGRLAVDIAASEVDGQRMSAADRIFIADADGFKAEFTDDDEVNGVVHVSSAGGRGDGVLGVFTLTAHSFMLRITDDPAFASGDLLQAFVRGCVAVGQVAPVPKGAPPPVVDGLDFGVSYTCTLQLEDAALVGCEASVVVTGAAPKKKKGKK